MTNMDMYVRWLYVTSQMMSFQIGLFFRLPFEMLGDKKKASHPEG